MRANSLKRVGFHHLREPSAGPAGSAAMRTGDNPGDAGESEPAGKEGLHRDLIGGVEHRGRCATGAQGGIGEPSTESAPHPAFKRQISYRSEIEGLGARFHALG